ncbi:alpha-ketoglutarate-dependent dioxygenase AlkB family protein [Ulvibacter antarcticus]|uniref:Alkylated DNA repair dioxygenase AlkB n=1 Tax=Ulvibacter antarcticus TaxID=442714 RepID=A0A3L9YDE6_9FLAO|nr:alpha-ketoglutarate-dependent dioxygenase AlkB [Ulvibacter antarcticus]RMA58474.1 alkylated DNA repair dioxygenase AlkB [Ulvibacter antarcticus]
MDLFSSEKNGNFIKLPLVDADVVYCPSFFTSEEATTYFETLTHQTNWQQDDITLFGKTYPQPRLTSLYATNSKPYSYSGITMFPKPYTDILKEIQRKIQTVSEENFTTVLLNLYRDGNDSNGWHSDDEKELGRNPVIASVSLGADRIFHFRNKKDKSVKHKLILENGSLLLMKGATQHTWQHQLPKSKKVIKPRINLTFRSIK